MMSFLLGWLFLSAGVPLVWAGGVVPSGVKDLHSAVTKILGHPPAVLRIEDGERLQLNQGAAEEQPWSGSFWPDILGGVANHYRDHGKFGDQFRYALRYRMGSKRVWNEFKNVCEKVQDFTGEELNRKLSPSEKYDLLLGDLNFSFSRAILEDIDFRAHYLKKSRLKDEDSSQDPERREGADNPFHYSDVQSSYDPYDQQVVYRYWKKRNDSISYWFGICDGWAPASITLPRPVKPVTVRGALGHQIVFFPDDLKALGSYLFARTNNDYMTTMNYRFAGRPCVERGKPSVDRLGYVKDFRCNDLDPGLWHLVLLNRIGLDRQGFMLDLDNNRKINNHPVGAYSLSYFNPLNGKEGTFENSKILRSQVQDGYARRRNPNASFLVGVKATVTYQYYHWPEENRDRTQDDASLDRVKARTYVYDLELDSKGTILGGEWGDRSDEDGENVNYSDQPDFLWMASLNALPYSEQSLYTIMGTWIDPRNPRPFGNMIWAWDGKNALPEDWARAAKADEVWMPPVVGVMRNSPEEGGKQIFPREARDSLLKPAQPLSNIIYYLFDQARSSNEH